MLARSSRASWTRSSSAECANGDQRGCGRCSSPVLAQAFSQWVIMLVGLVTRRHLDRRVRNQRATRAKQVARRSRPRPSASVHPDTSLATGSVCCRSRCRSARHRQPPVDGHRVVGGMLGATFLSLFLVPALYTSSRPRVARRAAAAARTRRGLTRYRQARSTTVKTRAAACYSAMAERGSTRSGGLRSRRPRGRRTTVSTTPGMVFSVTSSSRGEAIAPT